MQVCVNRYTGESLLNMVRQTALTRLREVRPVAFKVGAFSNMVTISDSVEEDMVEFIGKVSSSVYSLKDESSELFVWKGQTSGGCFRTRDMEGDGLTVLSVGHDELLHCFGDVSVEVYFRNGAGKYTAEQNIAFLRKHGVDTDSLAVVVSRHTPVSLFSYKKVGEDGHGDIYDITVVPKGGRSAGGILREATMMCSCDVDSMCTSFS